VRAIRAQEMPSDLPLDVVIGCVSTPACDQSGVFPTAPELILWQMRFPMRSETKDMCRSVAARRIPWQILKTGGSYPPKRSLL
jgi:hypothetical protein